MTKYKAILKKAVIPHLMKWDLVKEMNPNLIDLYDEIMLG